jgi:predicted component of type VI protein secretion system
MSQRFDATVITLGRGADADWTLPDPEQHLSKKHCTIQLQGGQYSITDTSTNGLYLNRSSQPLGRGQSAPLRNGDRLGLGDYELVIRIETGAEATAGFGETPFQPFANTPASGPGGFGESDPFGLGAQQSPFAPAAGGADPFGAPAGGGFGGAGGDPFGAPSAGPPGGFGIGQEPFAAPAGGAGNPLIPPDFGAAFPPDPALAPPLPGGGGAGPLIPEGHDFLGGAPQPAEPWQQQYSQPDHIPAQNVFFKPPEVAPPTIPDNWDAVFAAPSEPTTREQPPAAPAPPATPGGFGVPPAPGGFAGPPPQAGGGASPAPGGFGVPSASPAVARAPAPAPVPSAADGALLAAFLQGCGLPPEAVPPEAAAETMRLLGQTFRELVGGLRDVLTTRAMIKAEYRVEQTVIRSSNNNPLKFALDVDQAMSAMVGPPRQGYVPALKAAQEGFKDMKAHELALMAGMQAAVQALFREFDPEHLKQRLEKSGSVLDSLLPGAKKGKYWEIYEQQYKQITREMSEDVRGTFGRAFADAYEQQSKKL